jgi:hypothetical protein
LSAAWHRTTGWPAAAVLAAVVILAAGLAQTTAGHATLRTVGLFQEPTRYTSLAFSDPQALPEQLPAARVSVSVSFVIHNSGRSRRHYRWSVLLVQADRTRREAAGDTTIAAGHGAGITAPAKVSCQQGRIRIIVKLARPAETIDAWTTCWLPGS